MPRFPHSAPHAQGLSDRVFGQLVQNARASAPPRFPLHVGDTYLEPPEVARAESQRTAEHPRLHNYAAVQGEPALLDAIVRKIERRTGVRVDREHVQVMSGATSGLGVVCTALLEPGDEVLLPAPFWPLIRGIIRFAGGVPVEVPLHTRLHEPDAVAALERAVTPRTTALYLNSPHNPTGTVLGGATLDAIVDLALRHDLWVLTDEVYEDVWLGREPPEPLWLHPKLHGRVIVTHSLSKSYGLAGARVGYTHGPSEAMEVIRGVQTFYTYCAPRPLQLGAARVLDEGDGWLHDMRARYRDAAHAASDALGLPMPAGGTFLFFDAAPFMREGEDIVGLLTRCMEAGVMLTPGTAAGRDFASWARLCFTAVAPDDLGLALRTLREVLGVS